MVVENKKSNISESSYRIMVIWGSVPVVLFTIAFVIIFFYHPVDFITVFPGLLKILIAFIVCFALLGASLTSKLTQIVLKDIKKPINITLLLFLNAFFYLFFIESVREMFGEQDFALLMRYWWLIAIIWIIFPILETKEVRQFYNRNILLKRLSYLVRFPVYIIIFYSIFAFVLMDGAALFSRVFGFVICNISYFCHS